MSASVDELFRVPAPPDWRVDYDALDARFPWVRRLRGVPQDPKWHREGDVWIHTRLVCEALAGMARWRALDPAGRRVLWLAALLHDVAKPEVTRVEGDRIRTPFHAPRGAIRAREILWEVGVDATEREHVSGLVRHHSLPQNALEGDDTERRVSAGSLRCALRNLALLAEADLLGRKCSHTEESRNALDLFSEIAKELGCWEGPRDFPSDHTRVLFFDEGRPAGFEAYDDTRFTVTLLSGLPGAGKTTWRRQHLANLPVVCLDEIRSEWGVSPAGDQGRVRQEAVARAKAYLRNRRDFVWDATNLSALRRRKIVKLCRGYRARVNIVAVELESGTLRERNRARAAAVPEGIIRSMLRQWEMPDLTEAHRVAMVENGADAPGRQ